ncbi:MAG: GNAT family N-acetyltransferase [Desulfosarcinaceae bacterium]|nr:GNAT family N-acetyltransferase [Desulfosarcinaceae bacterium]
MNEFEFDIETDIDIVVRAARRSDASAVTALMRALGYDVAPDLMRAKIRAFNANAADQVLIAERHGAQRRGAERDSIVVGCITGHIISLFHQAGACGRVTSLVVAENSRGVGVGKRLLQEMEKFFRRKGCIKFEVTSGDHRHRAHRFYAARGYAPDERRFLKCAE